MSLQWHRPDYVQPPEADAGPAVNGIEYIARENQQRHARRRLPCLQKTARQIK
jgi:hypothetical protein